MRRMSVAMSDPFELALAKAELEDRGFEFIQPDSRFQVIETRRKQRHLLPRHFEEELLKTFLGSLAEHISMVLARFWRARNKVK
jgi:hypothetical protein